jgi:hypothetical protein
MRETKKKGKLDKILDKLIEHDQMFEELKQNNIRRHDEILGGFDKVMSELEKAREDRIFAKAEDDRQNERLDGLENRVEKVEARVG